jgi:CheY-like chemotaxis protein
LYQHYIIIKNICQDVEFLANNQFAFSTIKQYNNIMKQATILIIEDDITQAMMYEFEMSSKGFKVIVSNSGKEGLSKAQSELPDLIFLDMVLGDMTGQEILKSLKGDPSTKNIKVVALSNLNKKEVSEECKALGAVDFLVKMQFVPKEIAEKAKIYIEA